MYALNALVFLCATVVLGEDMYAERLDNVNIDEILQNDRLLTNYYKCLLNKGPCTAEGTSFKKILPDALKNDCSKCDEKQKQNLIKITKFISGKHPNVWRELSNHYDPEGVYAKKYADYLKET